MQLLSVNIDHQKKRASLKNKRKVGVSLMKNQSRNDTVGRYVVILQIEIIKLIKEKIVLYWFIDRIPFVFSIF